MSSDQSRSAVDMEQERLERLYETRLMDSPCEQEYDDLLKLATRLCGTDKGAITFVDDLRVFHKSTVGFEPLLLPRIASICDHTVRSSSTVIVKDLQTDERFLDKDLILESGLRFYAGAPLSTRDGFNLGAICVLSDSPRELSDAERQNLELIARQISLIVELRVEKERSKCLLKRLDFQRVLFEAYFNSIPVESCLKDANGRILIYNEALARRFEISSEEWIGKTSKELWPETVSAQIGKEDIEIWKNGQANTKYITVPYKGVISHWRYTRVPCRASDGQQIMLCISVDVTSEIQQRLDSEKEQTKLASTASQLRERLQRDDLTGLQNRVAFEAGCMSALFALKTTGKQFGVLSIDIGGLALFNRSYGMDEVDNLLRQVADALVKDGKANEVAARVAGGSYRMILSSATEHSLVEVARRIERQIDSIVWRGKVLSPAIKSQLFRDRQMHPGDLYTTPKSLVNERAGTAKRSRQSAVSKIEIPAQNKNSFEAIAFPW